MIFRNVSILTSSDPFSRAERSSETEGHSVADSNTMVWHDTSDEDIVEAGKLLLNDRQTFGCGGPWEISLVRKELYK